MSTGLLEGDWLIIGTETVATVVMVTVVVGDWEEEGEGVGGVRGNRGSALPITDMFKSVLDTVNKASELLDIAGPW